MNKIVISNEHKQQIYDNWIEYLFSRPKKLFKISPKYTYTEILAMIKKSKGFQITAFPGKAQNSYTNELKLPDFGEANLLCRIRAIQKLTNRPVKIILDGKYYANIFHEDRKIISRYEKALDKMAKEIGLNQEFPDFNTFMSVSELIKHLKISKSFLKEQEDFYNRNSELAYRLVGIWPKEMQERFLRILPKDLVIEIKSKENYEEILLNISRKFIILKAVLAKVLRVSEEIDNFKRITILKYSFSKNPRINLEMAIAPWNSAVLFKENLLNINTAFNGEYSELLSDVRNSAVYDEDNNFLCFTRKPEIFKTQ